MTARDIFEHQRADAGDQAAVPGPLEIEAEVQAYDPNPFCATHGMLGCGCHTATAACPRPHLDDLVPVVLPRKVWVRLGGWIIAHDDAPAEPEFLYDALKAIGDATG